MIMFYEKVRDVKTPERAHPYDAGIDFFVPNDFKEVHLRHGDSIMIASGIKVQVPKGFVLILFNKSGVASKQNLDVMACVIDCGYTGEVHINLINNGICGTTINPGQKIVQGILMPVSLCSLAEGEVDKKTQRGENGFGSTG